MLFPRGLGLLNENLSTKHGIPSYELFVSEVLDTPKTTLAIAIVPSCSHIPKLKDPIAEDVAHWLYDLEKARAEQRISLVFIVLKGNTKAAGGGGRQGTYPGVEPALL